MGKSRLTGNSSYCGIKIFPPISAPWPDIVPSWVWAHAPWKMSAKDAIATPIGCQRRVLCSILCFGDRFWQFYNFQFFGAIPKFG